MLINALWLLVIVPASALLGILVLTFVLIAHGDLGEKTERKKRTRKSKKTEQTEPTEQSDTVEQTATETHNASNSVGMV